MTLPYGHFEFLYHFFYQHLMPNGINLEYDLNKYFNIMSRRDYILVEK
jgi:hypothetical protein